MFKNCTQFATFVRLINVVDDELLHPQIQQVPPCIPAICHVDVGTIPGLHSLSSAAGGPGKWSNRAGGGETPEAADR